MGRNIRCFSNNLLQARPWTQTISTRTSGKFKRTCDGQVDVTELNKVIEIDEKNMRVVVQPYVSMGVLSSILLPLGYQLPCMPEMEDLTIGGQKSKIRMFFLLTPLPSSSLVVRRRRSGGLSVGYGIESGCHKTGLFFDACVLSVELVTGEGKLITVTPDNEHKELFTSLPWSCTKKHPMIALICLFFVTK